jgi:hypothetical protein
MRGNVLAPVLTRVRRKTPELTDISTARPHQPAAHRPRRCGTLDLTQPDVPSTTSGTEPFTHLETCLVTERPVRPESMS